MTGGKLEQEIAGLTDLSRAELVARWQAHYRRDPPKGISRSLLVRAIAYEMQRRRYGGLKPATDRQLRKVASAPTDGDRANLKAAPTLQPGARLVREWNGSTHIVDVIDGGFAWNGERYGSLSAIARRITGAHWSGPRFFGLTSDGRS